MFECLGNFLAFEIFRWDGGFVFGQGVSLISDVFSSYFEGLPSLAS